MTTVPTEEFNTGSRVLGIPEILKRACVELDQRRGGKRYRSPLPPDLKPPIDQLPIMT